MQEEANQNSDVSLTAQGSDKVYIVSIQQFLINHAPPTIEYVRGLLPVLGIQVKIYRDLVEATTESFTAVAPHGITAPVTL